MSFIKVDLKFFFIVGKELDTLTEELDLLSVFYLETHLFFILIAGISNFFNNY